MDRFSRMDSNLNEWTRHFIIRSFRSLITQGIRTGGCNDTPLERVFQYLNAAVDGRLKVDVV